MSRIVRTSDNDQVLVAGAGVEQVLIDDGYPVPLRYYVLDIWYSTRPTSGYLWWVGRISSGYVEELDRAEVFTRDRIIAHEQPEADTHWNDGCRYIAVPCERATKVTDRAVGILRAPERVHRQYLDELRALWRPLRPYMTAMHPLR